MKKLTKIKLVNWHLFSNETIEISDNTLISGENGAGKSTLLDAVQYLLVGGRSGAKFNIAANEGAKRTLEGYVRGRLGSEEREFLRPGDVVTHVALEFFDEDNDEYSIIGSILELPRNGTLKERFYFIEDLTIDDSLYLNGKYPKEYREVRNFVKSLDREMVIFNTQRSYREQLARFFGMDATKYAKILPKALAFKPIDLQAFIFEFLLDDDPVDIQSLKNNVEQLKRVESQIIKDREKLTKLDAIGDVAEEISNNKDQIIINDIINQLNYIEQRETAISQYERDLSIREQEQQRLRQERSENDILIEEVDAQIIKLERIRSNDDVERTLAGYQEQLNKKQIEYENEQTILLDLSRTLNDEFNVLKQLSNSINSTAFKDFISYYQTNESNLNPIELELLLTNVGADRDSFIQAYNIERDKFETEKQELSSQIYQIKTRISNLRKNIKTYPSQVQMLINVLNEKLSYEYNKDIRVQPLAELVEVNDERWRNALEGQLSSQKFNIIVEPEYFDLALKTYEEVQSERQIYGVGLVNTQKLRDYHDTNSNSLAAKLDTDYSHARNYVNMLLNNVITVENSNELKNYSRSITPNCMTYSNYTARQLNPRSYQTPYIGSSAIETQMEIELSDLNTFESRMDELQNLSNSYLQIIRALNSLKSQQIIHRNQIRVFETIKTTRREFANLEEQILALKDNPSIAKLENQLEIERVKMRDLRIKSDGIVSKIAVTRDDIERINTAILEAKDKLSEYSEKQDKLARENPEKLSQAHTQFYALKQRHKQYTIINDELNKERVSLTNQNVRKETELTNLMRLYNREYFFSGEPNFEGIELYLKEANLIRNNNLVKYEHEATELRRNSEIGFKEEFVNKLRASIETAQHQIEDLNVALEGKRFGNDSYKLVYRASDNPEFKLYYDMIMNTKAIDDHSLFTEGLNKRNEAILSELFEKIASQDPEHDKLTYMFLDYRNYMAYDIEVTHSNGNISMFSKVSREKSGGETQVPFYIVIAASFQQLLTRNKRVSSGCIVLFDEAFNNMDDTRIDAMMKYYSSLSIQLLIAIPPQRVINIINYVNTSVVIVKENDYAMVESFKNHNLIQD